MERSDIFDPMAKAMAVASALVLGGCCDLMPAMCDRPSATPEQDRRINELLGSTPEKADAPFVPSGQRCPDEWSTRYAGAIDSVCAITVPREGRLWFAGPDHQPCWCGCAALLAFDQAVRDSLVEARRASDIRRYEDRAARLVVPPERKYLASLKPDTGQVDSMPHVLPLPPPPHPSTAQVSACDRSDRKLPMAGRCVSVASIISDLRGDFPVFKIIYDSPGANVDYPSASHYDDAQAWEAGDPALVASKRARINVPSGLIENTHVGGELVAFLLAHEIGHALTDGFACNTTGAITYCEGECDFWSVNVGLRTVYDGPEFVELCEQAAQQIEAYELALWGADAHCGYPICACDDPECGYPPTDCRAKIIRRACSPEGLRSDRCIRNWHLTEPPSCPPIDCE